MPEIDRDMNEGCNWGRGRMCQDTRAEIWRGEGGGHEGFEGKHGKFGLEQTGSQYRNLRNAWSHQRWMILAVNCKSNQRQDGSELGTLEMTSA